MIWRHPENRGKRVPRLLRWLGWQAWQRTVRRPRVVHLHDGVRLVCHPHDRVTSLVLYCGLYDSSEMRFLLRWLRPGDTFFDVGANVAPYSMLSTLVGGVSAIAFEPVSLARQRARDNIRLNGVEQRVELVPCAVGDRDGPVQLTADRWATNAVVDGDYQGQVEHVEMIRLDSFVQQRVPDRLSLVKIDVEGHEAHVLRGAEETVARHRPALIVEYNDTQALQRFAAAHGYVPVAYEPPTGGLEQLDWPEEAGGNVILVPDFDQASERVATRGGRKS